MIGKGICNHVRTDAPRCTATTDQRQWHWLNDRIGCDETHGVKYRHHPYLWQEIISKKIISKKILKYMFSAISGVIYNPVPVEILVGVFVLKQWGKE